jgi:hypothetical protein
MVVENCGVGRILGEGSVQPWRAVNRGTTRVGIKYRGVDRLFEHFLQDSGFVG